MSKSTDEVMLIRLPRLMRCKVRYKRQVHFMGHALNPEDPQRPTSSFAVFIDFSAAAACRPQI